MIHAVQPESDLFRFTLKRDLEGMTITVFGKINACNGKPIRDRALPEITDGCVWIAIDLKAVESIDRRALGDLLSISQHARRGGGAVTVLDANPEVSQAFHKYAVAKAFTFAASEGTP